MEMMLDSLFDYQRFEMDPELQGIIDDVLERYSIKGGDKLSDDELEFAAAAGDMNAASRSLLKDF